MSKKMFLNALGIPALLGLRTKEIEVPGQPNVFVIVQEIGAMDLAELGAGLSSEENSNVISAVQLARVAPDIIARCVKDGDGNPVFTRGQARCIKAQSATWAMELVQVALELSEFTVTEDEQEKNP